MPPAQEQDPDFQRHQCSCPSSRSLHETFGWCLCRQAGLCTNQNQSQSSEGCSVLHSGLDGQVEVPVASFHSRPHTEAPGEQKAPRTRIHNLHYAWPFGQRVSSWRWTEQWFRLVPWSAVSKSGQDLLKASALKWILAKSLENDDR